MSHWCIFNFNLAYSITIKHCLVDQYMPLFLTQLTITITVFTLNLVFVNKRIIVVLSGLPCYLFPINLSFCMLIYYHYFCLSALLSVCQSDSFLIFYHCFASMDSLSLFTFEYKATDQDMQIYH